MIILPANTSAGLGIDCYLIRKQANRYGNVWIEPAIMFKCSQASLDAKGRGTEVYQLACDYEITLYQYGRDAPARISLRLALIQSMAFLGQFDGEAFIVTVQQVKGNHDNVWIVDDDQAKGVV